MFELRWGIFGVQGGFIVPRVGIALWRNRDYEPLLQWRWTA